ncbi:MAG: cbb3-type cytochrome oxidase subunit 3 [Candidatus Eiseniibacteriota bacterium]
MAFGELDELIHSLWVVWLLVVFGGIIVWVMWPRRKKELEEQAKIPFKDDDSE